MSEQVSENFCFNSNAIMKGKTWQQTEREWQQVLRHWRVARYRCLRSPSAWPDGATVAITYVRTPARLPRSQKRLNSMAERRSHTSGRCRRRSCQSAVERPSHPRATGCAVNNPARPFRKVRGDDARGDGSHDDINVRGTWPHAGALST